MSTCESCRFMCDDGSSCLRAYEDKGTPPTVSSDHSCEHYIAHHLVQLGIELEQKRCIKVCLDREALWKECGQDEKADEAYFCSLDILGSF